jgi:ABC-type glycerol-3-phosphate transport system substrate-binding protein
MTRRQLSRRDFLKFSAVAGAGSTLLVNQLVALASNLAQGQPITVRYRTPSWASTTDRRRERQIAFRGVIDSFNDAYASQGIQVVEVAADDNSVNMTQDIEAGSVDALWFNSGEYRVRVNAGHLADLRPYLNGEDEAFFEWVQQDFNIDGALYALWHNTDTPLYYYNTEKIPNPPTTWSELLEICQEIRAAEGGSQYAYAHPFVGWGQTASGMFVALGGEYVDADGAPVAFDGANMDIWKRMFEFYVGLVQDDLIPAASVASTHGQLMPSVFAGNVYSFAGNSNYHVRELQPNLPPDEYGKWAAVPLPYPDEAGFGLYEAGGWSIGAVPNSDSAIEAAAAAWVIHATGPRALANTCAAGVWIPTQPAILAEDPFYREDEFALVTLQALENGYVPPRAPIYGIMRPIIDTALSRATTGEVSIDEALAEAREETMREYEAL